MGRGGARKFQKARQCSLSRACAIWEYYLATHCNTLQHTLQYAATHCNTLHHTATHCNTLEHVHVRGGGTRSYVHVLSRESEIESTSTSTSTSRNKGKILQKQQTATDCNRLQQTATDCKENAIATDCNRQQEQQRAHARTKRQRHVCVSTVQVEGGGRVVEMNLFIRIEPDDVISIWRLYLPGVEPGISR